MKNVQKERLSWVSSGLFLGLILGVSLFYFYTNTQNDQGSVEIRQGGYTYINPLLECEVGQKIMQKTLDSAKQEVRVVLQSEESTTQASHVSVYFRDLNNGPWFGINEDEVFAPASLLKVPVLIAYYALAENDENILQREIASEQEDMIPLNIQEHINRMIISSDNTSFNLLANSIDFSDIRTVHQALGIPLPNESTPEDYISVKQYAALFRVLFNASYLNRASSESALQLMTEAKFVDGLVAGLPSDIAVAHKFGIRENKNDVVEQLHDCGIVYYPEHPYLLCVMTKGSDVQAQSQVIRKVSQAVFTWADKAYSSR